MKGMDATLRNLNTLINDIDGRTMAGLLQAGLMIQRHSQKYVPVEYGTLRQSAYTRKAPNSTKEKPIVEVGFSADYAVFVHENYAMKWKGRPRKSGKGVYWGPQGGQAFSRTPSTYTRTRSSASSRRRLSRR